MRELGIDKIVAHNGTQDCEFWVGNMSQSKLSDRFEFTNKYGKITVLASFERLGMIFAETFLSKHTNNGAVVYDGHVIRFVCLINDYDYMEGIPFVKQFKRG